MHPQNHQINKKPVGSMELPMADRFLRHTYYNN